MPKATTLFQTVDAAGRVLFDFKGKILTDLLNVRADLTNLAANKYYTYMQIVDDQTGVAKITRAVGLFGSVIFSVDTTLDDTGNVVSGFTYVVNPVNNIAQIVTNLRAAGSSAIGNVILNTKLQSSFLQLGKDISFNNTARRSMTAEVTLNFSANQFSSATFTHNWGIISPYRVGMIGSNSDDFPPLLVYQNTGNNDSNQVSIAGYSPLNNISGSRTVTVLIWELQP